MAAKCLLCCFSIWTLSAGDDQCAEPVRSMPVLIQKTARGLMKQNLGLEGPKEDEVKAKILETLQAKVSAIVGDLADDTATGTIAIRIFTVLSGKWKEMQ